jgi:NitT/TauT family transport system substrate-binding protein
MLKLLKAALVAIAVLSIGLSSSASAQTMLPVIRITAGPFDSYGEPYYAEAQGFFKKAGLDVQIESFGSGEQMAVAVAGGAADIGLDNPIHLALGMAHGANVVVIGGSSLYSSKSPTTALLVEKNSPIKVAKDLENATVGISGLKNIQELGIKAWLAKNGADISKIKFVEIPTPSMGPAVARGTVAAALVAEPFVAVSLANSSVRVLAYPFDAVAPNFYIATFFTTPQYLKQNPDLVKRFMSAIYEAAKWSNTHQAETAQVLMKVAKLDPDVLRTMKRTLYAEDMGPGGLQPQLDVGYKYGVLDKPTTYDQMIGH